MSWDEKFNRTAKQERNDTNYTDKKHIQSKGYTVQFCSLPDAQPAPEQRFPFTGQVPQLYSEHDITQYRISHLASLGQTSGL